MENLELTLRIGKALKSGQSVLGVASINEYKHLLAEWVSIFVPKAEEGSPRAIIIASSEQEAREIHELISLGTRELDLTVDLITEKGKKIQQRNDLFDASVKCIFKMDLIFPNYVCLPFWKWTCKCDLD
jgi:hypothetical protein